MARPEAPRRMIVNADDFGRSNSINQAVIQGHTDGILTTASLMVGEPACDEAVELARKHPRLGVGLHLTLSCGHAVLPPQKIPGLVNPNGIFENDPAAAGWRYFFQRALREPLRREIHAQFEKFHATGLLLDHVNGHQHMHLHPTIFRILMEDSEKFGIRRLRLTRDPFWLNTGLASGRWRYRASHALIYSWLSWCAQATLDRHGIRYTKRVFGLLQNGRVDESYVLRLLERLPPGDSELYSHPSLDEFKDEFEALLSAQVKAAVNATGVQLIRYQDL